MKIAAKSSATMHEILSQPRVWEESLHHWNATTIFDKVLEGTSAQREWLFTGCGTSFYLAEAAATSWTLITGQPARALPASELLLFPQLTLFPERDLQIVLISRSGRTSEMIRAAEFLSRTKHLPTLGITCAADTPLEKACDITIRVSAADEQSTVMTRSFTSMLLALQTLAARYLGDTRVPASLAAMANQFSTTIRSLPGQVEEFVAKHSFADYVFLGQGPFHSIAREASLKVTEMSCSYSQSFHTLEFRHGPKAIVSPDTCLTFFLSDTASESEVEVLAEMKELGGINIAVCNRISDAILSSSDLVFEIGCGGTEITRLAPSVVPLQMLGLFTGIKKGLDPDNPRNLTRVVILD